MSGRKLTTEAELELLQRESFSYALDHSTLMVENHRSGLLWRLMQSCPYIVGGLRRAGFTGGWLRR